MCHLEGHILENAFIHIGIAQTVLAFIYLFLGNVISVFVSSLILLLRSPLSFIHLPLFPFVPRHQHCVEVTSRATPAPSCLPASQTFTRITWTARGWSRPPTAKVSREILCRHMRQSNSISVTMSFPSTEWPFYFAEQAVFVRPGCWEAGLRLRRHGMILQPLVEHSYQTDWALFADALSAQVQLCLEKDREFVLNVLWYRKYCVFNVFFPPSWLLCMWCLLLCIYKFCKDLKNPNISTMALSSPRIQVSSSPSTPSTLRALTIIYWWQRTAASLSHFGGWRAPPCLRLSAQGCLETTQHRSASCLTFPFRMRDSTSPSLVRINLVLRI